MTFRMMFLMVFAAGICSISRADTLQVDSVLIRLIDQVDVPARTLGALEEIHVKEGMLVVKGQPLAQIDATEALLELQLAELEVAIAEHHASNDVLIRTAQKTSNFAQAEYERLTRAESDQPRSVSKSELEKSKLSAEQAKLEVERVNGELAVAKIKAKVTASKLALAKREFEIRKITAPSNGVVVNILHRPGEWVAPGEKIFRIVRTDRLRAEAFVAATDVLEDLKGAEVSVWPDLGSGEGNKVTGKVLFVSPEIDPVNGQVRVVAEIENSSGQLRPGLRAKMTIEIPKPFKR